MQGKETLRIAMWSPPRARSTMAMRVFEALGWPDDSFPANAVVSERKSVDEAARFLGFDD